MLNKQLIQPGFALIVTMLLASCAGQESSTDIDQDDLHTLPGRFAEEPVTQPLVAVEAYIGSDEFFLAYEGPDGLVYSGGNWSNRIDLNALRQGEKTVGELVEGTGGSQANVSKHLALLLRQGLVSRRKEGVFSYYEIRDPSLFELCELVCQSLESGIRQDRELLARS